VKFVTKFSSCSTLYVGYIAKHIEEIMNGKFFGLKIENHTNWKKHFEQIIPKLSGSCYSFRSMVHFSNISTL